MNKNKNTEKKRNFIVRGVNWANGRVNWANGIYEKDLEKSD